MTASEAITRAIRVKVACEYSAEQHRLVREQFSWIYTIDIENHGSETVQLLNRHWLITDAQGRQEEVRGPGVVGQQPVLPPGGSFRYSSGCSLRTPFGSMQGRYEMVTHSGVHFDVVVAPFALSRPGQVQ